MKKTKQQSSSVAMLTGSLSVRNATPSLDVAESDSDSTPSGDDKKKRKGKGPVMMKKFGEKSTITINISKTCVGQSEGNEASFSGRSTTVVKADTSKTMYVNLKPTGGARKETESQSASIKSSKGRSGGTSSKSHSSWQSRSRSGSKGRSSRKRKNSSRSRKLSRSGSRSRRRSGSRSRRRSRSGHRSGSRFRHHSRSRSRHRHSSGSRRKRLVHVLLYVNDLNILPLI